MVSEFSINHWLTMLTA